jgi:hypothetical protein
MRLEWKEDEGGDYFAEVANLLCIAYTWYPSSQSYSGEIWVADNGIDDVELYTDHHHRSLDEMKQHLEEKLIEILKVWHDVYEELTK